jgi:Skp family chaperone for outer membrane proteins
VFLFLSALTFLVSPWPTQDLADREAALAQRVSKQATQQADLAERRAALDAARTRLDGERRALEQRDEALQAAQAEVRCSCRRQLHCSRPS